MDRMQLKNLFIPYCSNGNVFRVWVFEENILMVDKNFTFQTGFYFHIIHVLFVM